MSDTTYTYAVAQIRALELSLLSAADIEQLVACKSQAQCLQLLAEKGWGGSEIPQEPEAILQARTAKGVADGTGACQGRCGGAGCAVLPGSVS